jgi:hypothetical protein
MGKNSDKQLSSPKGFDLNVSSTISELFLFCEYLNPRTCITMQLFVRVLNLVIFL